MKKVATKKRVKKETPKIYKVYGIVNLKTKRLIKVDMNYDALDYEFVLDGYDESKWGIAELSIQLI